MTTRCALAALLVLCGTTAPELGAQTSQRLLVASPHPTVHAAELATAGFDVLPGTLSEAGFQVIVTPGEVAALAAFGLPTTLLEQGRPYRDIAAAAAGGPDGTPPAGYPDLAAVEAQLFELEAAHPTLCRVVDITATYGTPTFEGRNILAVKISDNVDVDEDESNALIVSCHHCRELITPLVALRSISRLLEGYGTDPDITAVVDGQEIWIAPVWNPDGYEHVFAVDNLWRKNRRIFPVGIGTDLNRNYPFGWAAACSGSTSSTSSTYKGPGPASEAETATMVAFAGARRFARVLDYHSSGREVLWGYSCSAHPLASWLRAEAVALSIASGYGGAERAPSAEGEHYEWEHAAQGRHAFLIEVGTSFQPTFAIALEETNTVWPGVMHHLQRPISVEGHVRDACTGLPVEATVSIDEINWSNGERNGSAPTTGRYHVFLPDGSWTLRFEAPGHATTTLPVTVTGGGGTTAEVTLMPTGPTGCWEDLGGGTLGIAGPPQLTGTGTLEAGSLASLSLSNAPPGGLMLAWLSFTSVPAAFFGGTIHAIPLVSQFVFFADAAGEFSASTTWPAGVAPGTQAWFQFLLEDTSVLWGITLSNAVRATTP